MNRIAIVLAAAALPFAGAAGTHAEDAGGTLALELNAAQPSEKGCRLTFVVNNGLGADIKSASFELVLFDKAGVVDRITALGFKEMPEGKTKVSRFDLSGVDCGNLGRVLVNSVTECTGEGLAADACSQRLKTSSRAGIEFGL